MLENFCLEHGIEKYANIVDDDVEKYEIFLCIGFADLEMNMSLYVYEDHSTRIEWPFFFSFHG